MAAGLTAEVKKQSRIEAIYNKQAQNNEQLNVIISRLVGLEARLFGERPTATQKDATRPSMPGGIGALEAQAETTAELLANLDNLGDSLASI